MDFGLLLIMLTASWTDSVISAERSGLTYGLVLYDKKI